MPARPTTSAFKDNSVRFEGDEGEPRPVSRRITGHQAEGVSATLRDRELVRVIFHPEVCRSGDWMAAARERDGSQPVNMQVNVAATCLRCRGSRPAC
jgi:hypothetical protein